MHNIYPNPPVKWVGGKRQMLEKIKDRMPEFETYHEPFFGGGAVFFGVLPERAYINDSNKQLINMYIQLRDNVDQVMSLLDVYQFAYNTKEDMQKKDEYFKYIREKYNEHIKNNILSVETAALFIFLNKASFNGVYRVNSKGLYNVPSAHRKEVKAYEKINLKTISAALKDAVITCGDFEEACKAQEGDFVFFDSPYDDTFNTYQAGGFTRKDHERLASLYKRLSDKGVKCMLTNSNTEFIRKLYKNYEQEVLPVKRMVNRNSDGRKGEEIMICNYKI